MKHKNFLREKGFDLILIDTPPTISSLTQESLTRTYCWWGINQN